MSKRILILNGPNLNMLGMREPDIYGHQTLNDIQERCEEMARGFGWIIDFRQSNHEGELVTWIQEQFEKTDAILINGAAYTHTSIAIHDALKLHSIPIIEIHLSNPKERETFRHLSYIEPLAEAVFAGHGAESYSMGLDYLKRLWG